MKRLSSKHKTFVEQSVNIPEHLLLYLNAKIDVGLSCGNEIQQVYNFVEINIIGII